MSKHSEQGEQTAEDVLAAAVEAQCRQWERETGTPREAMWAQLSDADRIAVEQAQEHHADRMRAAGRAGW